MRKGVRKGAVLTAVTLLIGSCIFAGSVAADTNTTTSNSTNSPTSSTSSTTNSTSSTSASGSNATTGSSSGGTAAGNVVFPADSDFQVVAQTPILTLKADPKTGHFILDDKRNGNEYRSYPDPASFGNGPDSASAAQRIVSPMRFGYIDLTNKKPQANESSYLEELNSDSSKQTKIQDWKQIDGGFQFTFSMPAKQLTIPVQVKIQDDYLETKVIDSGIKENKYSLVWLMLYPAFGADKSKGQDGYLFVPDGSGTLINFQVNRGQVSNYQEPIYGPDWSFRASSFPVVRKQQVRMPVFGMKDGDKGFVAIAGQGAEYDEVYGSPSGSYTDYNWITAQMDYRKQYYQITSQTQRDSSGRLKGFDTFSKERFTVDRSVRYYILDKGKNDYVGMAERYRQYLMQEQGLKPLQNTGTQIPLNLSVEGGDLEKGVLYNTYIPATTTTQAIDIVKKLYDQGITKMAVTYQGWQNGGYSSYGGYFPVDNHIGGTSGMKQFIDYAHSLQIPVYLDGTNFDYNNTGGDGFNQNHDGVRDLSGSVQSFGKDWFGRLLSFVSPGFELKVVKNDLPEFKKLGADGIQFWGSTLLSDFNTNFLASRSKDLEIQKQILDSTTQTLGSAQVFNGNFYALGHVNFINNLVDDYSYGMNSSGSIPFAQIAVHGLVNYSSRYANERDDYTKEFLRSIEYGSQPNYLITSAPTRDLMLTGISGYSTTFTDWQSTMIKDYQRYNQALGDVQDKFIVGHQELSSGVEETTYSNGKQIVVNYNNTPYKLGTVTVAAEDFAVITGGGSK